MLKIRLQRFGKKNQPSFRLVVTDSRNSTKSGKFLEMVGFYNATTKEKNVKADRVVYWISRGAQVSGTVNNFLIREGVIKGVKVDVASRKKIAKEEAHDKEGAPEKEAPKADKVVSPQNQGSVEKETDKKESAESAGEKKDKDSEAKKDKKEKTSSKP